MSDKVLDSSALLALFFNEDGADAVEKMVDGAMISSVNLAEVMSKLADLGRLTEANIQNLLQLNLRVVDFTFEQAAKSAEIRSATKHLGLSLGDRCCLAVAFLENATAVTADRQWQNVEFCQIEVIR